MNTDTLPALKARAVATNDRYSVFRAMINTHPGPSWDVGPINFALSYLLTGSQPDADAAIELGDLWVAGGVGAISGDSYLKTREILYAMSILYDWLHPVLGARLPVWQAMLEQWAAAVWPETNPARTGAWAIDNPGSNYYHAFLTTWMVGLSLSGDSPQAPAILALARYKWDNHVLPYLNSTAAGGYFLEGTGYGGNSLRYLFWILEAHRTATGEDLLTTTPWIRDAITAKIHLTAPRLDLKAPLGDQTQSSAGYLTDTDRSPMLIATRFDPRAAPWLDSIQPNRMQSRTNLWEEVLFYTSPMPVGEPREAPSTAFFAPGAGILSSRSGWGSDAVQLVFWAGPLIESHQDRSVGEAMLFRGDWLMAQAKLRTDSGLAQDAIDHCVLTVDGRPQTFGETDAKIRTHEDTDAYTFAAANLAPAYQGQLANYLRQVFFLKSGYLLIADGCDRVNPASQVAWHLQTLTQPVINGQSFQAGRLFGKRLVPVASLATFSIITKAPGQTIPTYRLDILGDAIGDILVALEAGAAGQTTTTLGQTVATPGVNGIVCGKSFVGWLSGNSSWRYLSLSAGMHYLLGLQPNTVYQTPAGPLTSSPAGILSFIGNAVGQPVTITGGTVPTPTPTPIPGPTPDPTPAPHIIFGGYRDKNRNPVVLVTAGDLLLIQGSPFGSSKGTVTINGSPVTSLNWNDAEISVIIPAIGTVPIAAAIVVNGVPDPYPLTIVPRSTPVPIPDPLPQPAKSYTVSGTLLQATDGSLSGSVKLTPQ